MKKVKFTMLWTVAGTQEVELPDSVEAEDEEEIKGYILDNWDNIPLPKESEYVSGSENMDDIFNVEVIETNGQENKASKKEIVLFDSLEDYELDEDLSPEEKIETEEMYRANDYQDLFDEFKTCTLPSDIIVIADLGLWNGRHSASKRLPNKLEETLYSDCDYMKWYCDENDYRCDATHHDGTNHYLYRMWKEDIEEDEKEEFEDIIFRGYPTKEEIEKYTVSLRPVIANLFGWEN